MRRLALSLPDVTERRYHARASFEVRGRSFAVLETKHNRARLMLSRQEQDVLTRAQPRVFAAAPPGRDGFTIVELRRVDAWLLEELLVAAWRRVVPPRSAARWDEERFSALGPAREAATEEGPTRRGTRS